MRLSRRSSRAAVGLIVASLLSAALVAVGLVACGELSPEPMTATPLQPPGEEPRRRDEAESRAAALDALPPDLPQQLPTLEVEGAPGALRLEELDVKVQVLGRLARTSVTQVYRNTLMRRVEGSYQMQLPDAAVISRLAMDVEGVMTEGELVEKERARGIYESIVRSQKDPALLEWQGNNRFKMQVFPIPASGTKTIVLEYEELLPVRGQRVHYGYGLPALGAGGHIDRFAFALESASAGAATVDPQGGYLARVDDGRVDFQELDFEPRGALRVSFPRPEAGTATVLTSAHGQGADAEEHFLVDWVPELPPASMAAPHDLVLALDTSRGIGDRELLRAAELARRLATRRQEGRVVVVTGDLETRTCTTDALSCLSGLRAGGATDLEALFDAAARAAAGLDRAAVVLFTDGVATVGELDADLLRTRFLEQLDAERTSVFTVAIGHEPDGDFLAALANDGRGHPLRLTPASSLEGALESLEHLLAVPLLLEVSVEVYDGDAQLVEVPVVNLRPGEPLAVLGSSRGEPFELLLHGTWDGMELRQMVRVVPPAPSADPLVTHFWARASIEALERAGAPRQDMVHSSLRYGVMSKATSFLVLENEEAYRRFGVDRLRQEERSVALRNSTKGQEDLQEHLRGRTLGSKADGAGNKNLDPGLLGKLGALGGERALAGPSPLGFSRVTEKIGTRGRGSGEASYAGAELGLGLSSGSARLGGRGKSDVTLTQGAPVVLGSLDKELIRRVVRQHLAQLQYCYERELQRSPELAGKVVMKWVINGQGRVTQAQVAETQLRNSNVEGCLAARIKTWTFPAPHGGGIVIINYPFVFKRDGVAVPPAAAAPSVPRAAAPMPPPPPPPPPTPPAPTTLEEVLDARRADLLDVNLLLTEVRMREQLGDVSGARRALSELVELAPHDLQRRQRYADALLERSEESAACEELGHITSLDPSRRDLFRRMMGLRRVRGSNAAELRDCVVDAVSRLPVQRALSLVLTWEDAGADVDLHILGPGGEHVFFSKREGKDGGLLYYDVIDGYGPEIYTLGQAHPGRYRIGVTHYRGPESGVRGTLTILEDAGTPAEKRRHVPFRLGPADPSDLKSLAVLSL